MANQLFAIKTGPKARVDRAVNAALEALRDGGVIIAPLEHAYAFVADAFNHGAVAKIHQMRGDTLGVAAQVLVRDIKMASGLTHSFNSSAHKLAEKYWPGLLTIYAPVQRGLTWNLGDSKELEKVALRVPANRFFAKLFEKSGPLAVASAARVGAPAPRDTSFFPALDSDIALTVNSGKLIPHRSKKGSTIVEISGDEIKLIREGAISERELKKSLPGLISAAKGNA
jgi:L-threonylcarbamoyladenylate synthase